MPKIHFLCAAAVAWSLAIPTTSSAQIGGFIKRKAKERIEQKIVECLATDLECIRKAKAEGKDVKVKEGSEAATDAAGASSEGGASASLKPGEGAWANYDFKPGDKILFADDLTKDEVGDFPKRLEFIEGTSEIVEWKGGRYLRGTSNSRFEIRLAEPLPERFTLEFDYSGKTSSMYVYLDKEKHPQDYLVFYPYGEGGIEMVGRSATARVPGATGAAGDLYKVRIMGDGKYIKVYMNEARVANVPNADLGRTNKIHFWVGSSADNPSFLTNFKLAAGGKKLYDALTESGRVATQGIYFDSGSDRIKPESTPTLKEIGAMLKEHADLKLTIEGHTDNVGNAQSNHDLSHKRAAAVKAILSSSYGIDGSRLEATGFGDKKPAAPNTTPEGRQQNRRVELVKG
ncbi:MAG: OmpA family protein [Anaerolineae bacterium]|nr:OmpA family protein [Gemmatimonadaceae bacterium]